MMHTSFVLLKRAPRTGVRLLLAICFASILTGSFVGVALAHKPLFKSGDICSPAHAQVIPDPKISWAVYASLDHASEADYYTFQAKAGLPLDAQITIPAITSLQQFAPHLALIGPGLSSSPAESISFTVPAGDGIQLLNAAHAGTSDQFDEPFTQTTYWNRQTLKEPLSVAGTYYLVVFNRPLDAIQTGKYVLAVGDIEQFGPADLVTFPAIYFHVRFFTGAGLPLWSWIAIAVIVLLIIGLVWRRRNRRARRALAPSN